jgi:opacity protein-like surface antigen
MVSSRVWIRLAAAALLLTASGPTQAQLYWRVDLGWSFSTNADFQDNNFTVDGVICGDAACTVPGQIKDVGSSGIVSGGVGWRFNPNLRADATISYRGGYTISETMPDGTSFASNGVYSWNIMANGYYDFALTWGKPYVGAGVGWAQNRVDDTNWTNSGGIKHGGTWSGVAWTVMGGVGVPISSTLTLDLGVRYTDLGKIVIDPGAITFGSVATGVYSGANGRLRAWEVTVGLRF